MTIEGLENLTS